MTKRQENAQETRRRIYTTACSLIAKNGFANVSVEDITRACGVAKGTFYVYFKRKEEIIFECCKEWFSDVDRKAREHNGTIVEKLAFYFKGFMEGVTCGGVELCRQWVREVINPSDSPCLTASSSRTSTSRSRWPCSRTRSRPSAEPSVPYREGRPPKH